MECYKIILLLLSSILFIILVVFYFYSITKKTPDLQSDMEGYIEERTFMENLLNQRFNFSLLILGLILAASYQIKDAMYLDIILTISFVVLSSLSITIFRAQIKLDYILEWIFSNKINHAASQIHNNVKGLSVRKLIGYHLPFLFSLLCFTMLMLSIFTDIIPIKQ